jgi:hypothetical protein
VAIANKTGYSSPRIGSPESGRDLMKNPRQVSRPLPERILAQSFSGVRCFESGAKDRSFRSTPQQKIRSRDVDFRAFHSTKE